MRKTILSIIIGAVAIAGFAQEIRFHDEAADTIRINELLGKAIGISDPNERIAALAMEFIDTPYVGGTLESENERLTINLSELDCTTFVDNLMAMGITVGEGRSSWRDFTYNLQNIRYRKGEINGYPSRLHYISDWVVDNVHRGNFEEVTNRYPDVDYEVKTLDFMTRNRDLYPALSDSANFERMKSVEIGYRNHRYPIIRVKNLPKAAKGFLKEGDIIAITTAKKGIDVTHMGVVKMKNGVPHLLHASSKTGKVIVDPLPLTEYLKRDRFNTGIRVFRIKE